MVSVVVKRQFKEFTAGKENAVHKLAYKFQTFFLKRSRWELPYCESKDFLLEINHFFHGNPLDRVNHSNLLHFTVRFFSRL